MKDQDQECCPTFVTAKWHKKTFHWENKRFLVESIPTFFHIPLPPMIGKKIDRMHETAKAAHATIPAKAEALILFGDPSAFKSEIYYAVTQEVAGAHNTSLSGKFFAMVFEDPYNSVPIHIKEMEKLMHAKDQEEGKASKHLDSDSYYIHYAYCDQCAKRTDHNYMVIFALVD